MSLFIHCSVYEFYKFMSLRVYCWESALWAFKPTYPLSADGSTTHWLSTTYKTNSD